MWSKILVSICVFELVACKRDAKLLTFNFLNDDIKVDLDFSIPFVTIPVRKSDDPYSFREFPSININPVAFALGGAVIVGTTFILPLILKSYALKNDYRYSRILENTEFSTEKVLSFINSMWSDSRGVRGCTQRVACWTAKQQNIDTFKVMNFVLNNKILSTMINATAIEDAMLSGRHGRDCMTYTPCPIPEEQIPVIVNSLVTLIRPPG